MVIIDVEQECYACGEYSAVLGAYDGYDTVYWDCPKCGYDNHYEEIR